MRFMVFSVFDSKTEAFLLPFFTVSKGSAIRMVMDAAMSNESTFGRHAADYTLFHLGSFDDSNAQFTPEVAPMNLGCLIELVGVKPLPTREG